MKPTTQTPPRLDFVVVSSSGGAQYPFVEIATAPSSKLRVETVTHRGNTALALWEILPNEDLEAALSETGLCIKPIQFGQTFRLFDCVTAQLVNVGQPSS